MKIGIAQISSVRGDINANLAKHRMLIERAATEEVDVIIFPELSVTGYEPTLAAELAVTLHHKVLDELQHLSMYHHIIIGAGVPLRSSDGVRISLVFFFPDGTRKASSKKFLHSDEEQFFVAGENLPIVVMRKLRVAPAICYEISVDAHLEEAIRHSPDIYIASVAKSTGSIDKSLKRLCSIAKDYRIPVMMSNAVGPADNFECAGKSTVWDSDGKVVIQFGPRDEGLLIYDTVQKKAFSTLLKESQVR